MVKPHNYKYFSERVRFTEPSYRYHKNGHQSSLKHISTSFDTILSSFTPHTNKSASNWQISLFIQVHINEIIHTINEKITLKTNILHIYKPTQQCFSNFFTWGGGRERVEGDEKKEEHRVWGYFLCFEANKITMKLDHMLIHQQNNTSYCMLIFWWVGSGCLNAKTLNLVQWAAAAIWDPLQCAYSWNGFL
jgi:hypothetical protein